MLAINRGLDEGKEYSTPPPLLSPNPYNRGGFLRGKNPPPSTKFDLGVNSVNGGRRAARMRPQPLRVPSDYVLHDSVSTGVYKTPRDRRTNETRGSIGSTLRESRRCSPASSRSASPQKPPWYPAGSPASSRSASPHKRPWYPAGGTLPQGERGRSGRDDQENAYVVRPTFRHLFLEPANRSDGNDDGDGDVGVDGRTTRLQATAAPDSSVGGSACSSSSTAATVPQRSETDRQNRSAIRERRGGENAHRASSNNSLPGKHQLDKLAGSGRANNNERMSRQKVRSDAREDVESDTFQEPVTLVRDSVRGLQSRAKPRMKEKTTGLSDDGRRRARPTSLSSAVMTGHSKQVLALTQRQDIIFSAASDGTAKAWDTYSHQCLATYEGHRKAVWAMQVTSRTLITGSADGTVRFWDIETTRSLHVIEMHSAVRDVVVVGGFIAVATANPCIEVIDLSCMKPHGTLEGHIMAVSALASLEGGACRVVSGSHDTFIRVWDPDTASCEAVLGGHEGTIGALCTIFLRPSTAVLSGAACGATGNLHRGGETATSQESLIVSGSGDSTVRVWGRAGGGDDMGEWACRAVLQGHRHGVWAVHGLSLSGGVFATGGGDATVKIWAPSTNTKIGEMNGSGLTIGGAETASERPEQHDQLRWECVGGVRGAAGAVGAVLMNEEALVFGTSEALIARFPLQLCMPKHGPA